MKRSVEHLSGTIAVSENPSGGTIFDIKLPTSEASQSVDASFEEAEKEVDLHGARVLVVDDEPLIRESIALLVKRKGGECIVAADGQQAVERFSASSDSIDIVIMDIMMPEMNGSEAIRLINEQEDTVPVIVVSGFASDEIEQDLQKRKVFARLHKPFDHKELLSVVVQALERSPSGHDA